MKISKRNKRKLLGLFLFSFLFYWFFPAKLFQTPYSTLINDENGELLSAQIAEDGQWRFPEVDSVPYALEQCILHFEDEYFYYHPGVNPVSTLRAIGQNISSGKVVSGGSTLTMQVIRLSRQNQKRTYWEKLKEYYLALRMEFSYSKEEVLKLYVSHAPYGGNVVGAEAAAWRYFQRPLHQLSWAEYATLAVLPNAPSLIRPGKNAGALQQKRDVLLRKLLEKGVIDQSVYELSLLEPLPGKPHEIPNLAFHFMTYAKTMGKSGTRVKSTLDAGLQKRVVRKVNNYVRLLEQNEIKNACALVIDLKSGEVKSYVGNATHEGTNAAFVDLVQAPRSSGSILKPFLYAATLEEGMIYNTSLIDDVPISIQGFSPSNFDKSFDGVVRADEALARSLNIPATNLLKDYGVPSFYNRLNDLGFTTINRTPDNYGLSLILGGAEVNLWDVAGVYARQVMNLNNFFIEEKERVHDLVAWNEDVSSSEKYRYDAGNWWLITEALKQVQRPGLEESWKQFSSSRKIAWKTGTSFGFKDAWAVGYDANYLVAIWVGNAEGEGRPGLTGTSVAAPLMFDVFQDLQDKSWFEKPLAALKFVEVCENSGYAPTPNCPRVKVENSMKSKELELCTFHQHVLLNEAGKRIRKDCGQEVFKDTIWFVLEPRSAYYFKKRNRSYRELPSFDEGCGGTLENDLDFIYPQHQTTLIVPKSFKGEFEKVILEATHRDKDATLYWHLDDGYLGETTGKHELKVDMPAGEHILKIMDRRGQSKIIRFVAH